jgi:hypothetical protein
MYRIISKVWVIKKLIYLDNNKAGQAATNALFKAFKPEGVKCKAMKSVYEGHLNLNAWHMHNLNLK